MKISDLSTRERMQMLRDLYLLKEDELHCQFIKDIVESLLPSDEEINNKRCELYPGEGIENDAKFSAFGKGAKWLKQQILNKLNT